MYKTREAMLCIPPTHTDTMRHKADKGFAQQFKDLLPPNKLLLLCFERKPCSMCVLCSCSIITPDPMLLPLFPVTVTKHALCLSSNGCGPRKRCCSPRHCPAFRLSLYVPVLRVMKRDPKGMTHTPVFGPALPLHYCMLFYS